MTRPLTGPWPLSRIIGTAIALIAAFAVAAVVIGALALAHLNDGLRQVENVIDPAALQAEELGAALLNQETGPRGYALSAKATFLAPYTDGQAAEASATSGLRELVRGLPAPSGADLGSVIAQAQQWRSRYAEPAISRIEALAAIVIAWRSSSCRSRPGCAGPRSGRCAVWRNRPER